MITEKFPERVQENLLKLNMAPPTEWQSKIYNRLKQGGDMIALSDDVTEKDLALVLSAIFRSPDSYEGSPRVLIITPDSERALTLHALFQNVLRRTEISVELAHDKGVMLEQRNHIYAGADIIIGNPKRVFDLYIQNGINLTLLKLFILDDTQDLVKKQIEIRRITDSLPKCQRLVFTSEINDRMEKILGETVVNPLEIQY